MIFVDAKFLLDGMLGTLARWLRISGYDAKYLQNAPDAELVDKALEEDRILLTRDKLLHRKAVKAGAEAMFVRGKDDIERLSLVSGRYGLALNPHQSRCTKCDGLLSHIEKSLIRHKIPKRTYEAFEEFFICGLCGQVYWKGSHWNSIVETLRKASQLAIHGSNKAENDLYNHESSR